MASRGRAGDEAVSEALAATGRSIRAEIDARHAALSAYRSQGLSPLSFEQTIDGGVALTARTLRADRCAVALLVEGGTRLLLCAGRGWHEHVFGQMHMAAHKGTLGGYAIEHKTPVVVEDLARFPDFEADPLLAEYSTVSALVMPIWSQDGPNGILGAFSSVRRLFGPLDVEFAWAVADVIGAAECRTTWRQRSQNHRHRMAPTEW